MEARLERMRALLQTRETKYGKTSPVANPAHGLPNHGVCEGNVVDLLSMRLPSAGKKAPTVQTAESQVQSK